MVIKLQLVKKHCLLLNKVKNYKIVLEAAIFAYYRKRHIYTTITIFALLIAH